MLDVLLVQPFFKDFYRTYVRNQPIGLMYLKSLLFNHGYKVEIYDFLNSRTKQTLKRPKELRHLNSYYSSNDFSPAALYRNYFYFGSPIENFIQYVRENRPVVIAISALFTGYLDSVFEIVDLIKKEFPNIKIVLGGYAVSFEPEQIYELKPEIDYIIYNEGEPGILGLVDYLAQGKGRIDTISNLCFKEANRIFFNQQEFIEDLNSLSFPNRSHLNFDLYKIQNRKLVSMVASRGCPYNCSFCSIHTIWNNQWRKRSVDNIINELKFCVERYDTGFFNFEDDNLALDKKWFRELWGCISEEFQHQGLKFSAMNGINYHLLDKKDIELLIQAGFEEFNFSISTHSVKTLFDWQRPAGLKKFEENSGLISKKKKIQTAYFIVGAPGQNASDNLKTVRYLSELPVFLGPSIYYLTPGQCLMKEFKIDLPDNFVLYRSSSCYPDFDSFSFQEKLTILRICRYVNSLKNIERIHDKKEILFLKKFLKEKKILGMDREKRFFEVEYNDFIVDLFFQLMLNSKFVDIQSRESIFPEGLIQLMEEKEP